MSDAPAEPTVPTTSTGPLEPAVPPTWRRLLRLDVAVVAAAIGVGNTRSGGEMVWATIVAAGLGWLLLSWPLGGATRAVTAARVVGAWAAPFLLLHATSWLRLACPSVPLVWWGGALAAVVGGAALASRDGRRRWAWAPSALVVPFVLLEDPGFDHLELTLLGTFLGLIVLWGVALLLTPQVRERVQPSPLRAPAGPPPVWLRAVVRCLLGAAIARVAGAGGGALAMLVAGPLESRGVRQRWVAPALVLGAYLWGVVAVVQTAYVGALHATRSLDTAFQAASATFDMQTGSCERTLRTALLIAAVVAPAGALTLGSRLRGAALVTLLAGPLIVLAHSDQVSLSVESISHLTLGIGLWTLVGVAVGSASDRLAEALTGLAPGSERARAEPEPNPGPGGPDVAPTR